MSDIPIYNPAEIEPKWQEKWENDGLYHADINPEKEKHYSLTMLPYPSGNLHIGHWYVMAPSDARSRYLRMKGFNVLFPMGFDAFGLPAENAAIKNQQHPKDWTYRNIDNMRRQMKSMGAMFDWRREATSSDPKYYHWTQWFFLKLFEHNLAYRKNAPVDWCPTCNTTLAREQVWGEDRHCERCNTPVIKKNLTQWFFKTTAYVDELLNFEHNDWPSTIEHLQTNWIGRSEGASVIFKTETGDELEVFTTRPDTLWGATFMVLAPEHPLVEKITSSDQKDAVEKYIEQTLRQSDIQREAIDKDKTGVFTGGYAINPVNDEKIPIWIADYVLMTYGTGAIMAVPAHDQRDFEFARKFGLEIRIVIQPDDIEPIDSASMQESVEAKGTMVNSGLLTGTDGKNSFKKTIAYLEEKGTGKYAVNYRLRDWLISRQRYWGAPIPMIHCEKCGVLPVPEDQLPVMLPDDVEWKPTGESPLKLHPDWRFVECPKCGGKAERDTDTMDTFMCSSWYHLRYLSPDYDKGPFDPEEYDYWMPVDTYTGGIEHATMHLIYTRFFHKACRDMGITKGPEPMIKYRNQGIVLGEDSEKMSKSRGNVVSPDDLVDQYGADVVRAYLMFFARWNLGGPWNSSGIEGVNRWLKRIWALVIKETEQKQVEGELIEKLQRKLHQTIQSVTNDFEEFEFNTIISALMELSNDIGQAKQAGLYGSKEWNEIIRSYLLMLAPVAPHIAEELWGKAGGEYSIHEQLWPKFDAEIASEDLITIPVQVNGKLRDKIEIPVGMDKETIIKLAIDTDGASRYLQGKEPKRIIYVPEKMVNILV